MPAPSAYQARMVYRALAARYPNVTISLNFSNPLELTVATVLSAQCTDARVNVCTETLFANFHTPEDYLAVPEEVLQDAIHSLGFFRQKTKSLRGIMEALLDRFGGQIPATMEELTSLPGIGRKTANVILGNAFGIPGIPVDTHVQRVSRRIGLSDGKTPEAIETDLMTLYPRKNWTRLSHLIIAHGRQTCHARKPACDRCPVASRCRALAATQEKN